MKSIKTYVVNLPQSLDRHQYMEDVLSPFDFLDVEFFPAVYGKHLSEEELTSCFDAKLAFKRYGRNLDRGEIGCSLSHFGIYKRLLESNDNFCLIFEDDITILKDITILPNLVSVLDCDTPRVLFLSGDYWYTSLRAAYKESKIASVYDAVGTYAYFINRSAAELILKKNKLCANVADNWSLFRQQGVSLKAVFPYLVDANIESFESEIKQTHFGHIRKHMPFGIKINSYIVAFVKRVLGKSGHFVAKIRVPRCH